MTVAAGLLLGYKQARILSSDARLLGTSVWEWVTYTLNGFAFHEGPTGAPILTQAAGWFDCEVRNPVDCGGHTFFIGEIVDCAFTGAEDTAVLRMEDTRMSYGG